MSDDFGIEDEAYYRFSRPARLGRAMHTLQGYVEGIAADDRVKDVEIANLVRWLTAHQEFADKHPFNEVIPTVQRIVADGIVDEEERADLIWLCGRFAGENQYFDQVTSDMQRLQGILAGILSDGVINVEEITALRAWADTHEYLRTCWPYDELDSIITHVMADGVIDPQEHEALIQFFGEFCQSGNRQAVGALDREFSVSGVCATCPEIVFDGRYFCFTGKPDRGRKEDLGMAVLERGGSLHERVKNDTHFLVVGAKGNQCWAYACYGRKVEDAVYRRRSGQKIVIVHEYDFWDAVEEAV